MIWRQIIPNIFHQIGGNQMNIKMLVMDIQLCSLIKLEVFDLALLIIVIFGDDFPVFKKRAGGTGIDQFWWLLTS